MGIGGRDFGGNMALENKGVHEEVTGKNHGVCHREANIKTLCRRREDGGFQKVPKVVGPRTCPHTGGEVGRMKEKIFSGVK